MNKEQDMNWEDTQKWADQKIAGLLAVAQRMGSKEIVGQDPRDKLTTKEQQYELMQQQAQALKQKVEQQRKLVQDEYDRRTKNGRPGANLAKKSPKTAQDELFDLFAERLAKKLGELGNKKPQQ